MKRFHAMWAVVCAATLVSQLSYGQAVNATLLGTVTDATGAVVANAQVTALETATGSSRAAQTNASGNYTFPNVVPGNYSITVEQEDSGRKHARTSPLTLIPAPESIFSCSSAT
jgi:protocatechuate 3,4-dioxygenase beta subunit